MPSLKGTIISSRQVRAAKTLMMMIGYSNLEVVPLSRSDFRQVVHTFPLFTLQPSYTTSVRHQPPLRATKDKASIASRSLGRRLGTLFRHSFKNCMTLKVSNATSKLFFLSNVTAAVPRFNYFFSPRKSVGVCFYRRWFVCLSVCLSVTTITKKIVDGFVPNFLRRLQAIGEASIAKC